MHSARPFHSFVRAACTGSNKLFVTRNWRFTLGGTGWTAPTHTHVYAPSAHDHGRHRCGVHSNQHTYNPFGIRWRHGRSSTLLSILTPSSSRWVDRRHFYTASTVYSSGGFVMVARANRGSAHDYPYASSVASSWGQCATARLNPLYSPAGNGYGRRTTASLL